jgi:hypothetical protein
LGVNGVSACWVVAAPAITLPSPKGAAKDPPATAATAAAVPACLKNVLRLTGSICPPSRDLFHLFGANVITDVEKCGEFVRPQRVLKTDRASGEALQGERTMRPGRPKMFEV